MPCATKLKYTIRAYIEGRNQRLDDACRVFCSMERSAYNLLREGNKRPAIKAILRSRYGVTNAVWVESAMSQAWGVVESQQKTFVYRIELYKEKIRNVTQKIKRLPDPMKVQGCERKLAKLLRKLKEVEQQHAEKSYPRAVFGSKKLFHQLSISSGKRRDELLAEWRDRRSNRLFSVGQANKRGNGNLRLLHDPSGGSFRLKVRNWPGGDFSLQLKVPEYWNELLKVVIEKAESVILRHRGFSKGGLPYSVRVVHSTAGYQVLVSFELDEPAVEWSGRVAGIDVNPEGMGCTIVSKDGNLVASRFFGDDRFTTASSNKRKWLLEDEVNKMLRWCRDSYNCNAVVTEGLRLMGAFDFPSATNFKLINFMKKKMRQRVRLSALKMGMMTVEVDPAYTSRVALAKYGKRFGGFNRHQLAAFVIGRRVLGYGEAPVIDCLPKTRSDAWMWNRSIGFYGHQPEIQTLACREPLERKSVGYVNGGRVVTKLLRAPPALNPSQMGLSHYPSKGGCITNRIVARRAGKVRLNGHTSRGDGARGRRVNPPDISGCQLAVVFDSSEDNVR